MYGAYRFEYGDYKSQIIPTLDVIEARLLDKSPSKGLPRYENDAYFKSDPPYLGNPWFVATLWLAQIYFAIGEESKGQKYLDWSLERLTSSGMLSEQVDPTDSSPKGVTPLVWSHAELINTILEMNS